QHEEQHQLVLAPKPPVPPRVLRPDRSGDEHEHAEDHALVDRDVALEVGVRVALPEMEERFPRAEPEAEIRRERDRHMEVEDPLREPEELIVRRDEEHERERRSHENERRGGKRGQRNAVRLSHCSELCPSEGHSVTTYSNEAQQTSMNIRS